MLSLLLTPLVGRLARQRGWIARPKEDRWHKTPTALMGGIAIFIAMGIPLFMLTDFTIIARHFLGTDAQPGLSSLSATLFAGGLFLFLLGLVDDLRNIKPQNKLIGQIIAAAFIVFLGFRLHWFTSLTIDTMATLFWIVGITNAFNLLDNMDGLCAGVGTIAALSFGLLFGVGSSEGFSISCIIAGSLAGFLVFNYNPAKIFMGDCGSLVIGFSLAVLALYFTSYQVKASLTGYAVPILVLLVPLLDTTLVTVIRLLSGRKASTGGRDHTSHRLVLMGFSEKKAVLLLYGIGIISGLAANFVTRTDSLTSPVVILPVIIAIFLMGIYLSQLRVYPEKEFSALRNQRYSWLLLDLTYKKQLLLVILDLVLVAFAYYLSYRLRFGGSDFVFYFRIFLQSLPAIIGCKLLVFFWLGIYRGFWAYLSTSDVYTYIRASLAATLLCVTVVTFVYRFKDFSKGIFIIDFFLTTGLMLGARGSFRMFLETYSRKTLSGPKVLIYGAGRAGELLLREILNNKQLSVTPVGFIDDDELKKGKKLQGYPIIGSIDEIRSIIAKLQPEGVLVSFSEGNGRYAEAHRAIEKICREQGLFLKKFQICLQSIELRK